MATDSVRERQHPYDCDKCGETNHIPDSVVRLCSEHWDVCGGCGHRQAFNFSGVS